MRLAETAMGDLNKGIEELEVVCRKMAQRASYWGATGPHQRHRVSLADQLSRRAPEGRRALALRAPAGHTVLWVAIASGVLSAPDELRHGDLAAFEPSSEAMEFEALTDAEFVLGSAAPHEHDLVSGYNSVHTSPDALRDGEAHISSIKERLVQEGRL